MTACLYVSPRLIVGDQMSPILPVVFADTLATLKNRETGALAPGERVLPTIITQRTLGVPQRVRIVRKLRIADITEGPFAGHQVAAAYAGDGDRINELHSDLIANIGTWMESDRPLRKFGDQANKYNDHYKRVVVEALAVVRRENQVHHVAYFADEDFGYLGRGAAIGSGREDLRERARSAAKAFEDPVWDRTELPQQIRGLAGWLNGQRLMEEILSDGETPNGWGSYLEYALLDTNTGRWHRGPTNLHLFYVLPKVDDGVRTSVQISRAIAYDPGEEAGRIISLWHDEEGRGAGVEFILDGNSNEAEDSAVIEFWENWQPYGITATFFLLHEDVPQFATKSNALVEHEQTYLSIAESGISYGIMDSLLDNWASAVCERYGDAYRPHRDLSVEQKGRLQNSPELRGKLFWN